MTAHVTLESKNEVVLRLVADFARGLGCVVDVPPGSDGRAIRIALSDASVLLELMTHVALSATKANIDLDEPVCRVTFQHANAPSVVTLGLRIAEFNIDTATTRTTG